MGPWLTQGHRESEERMDAIMDVGQEYSCMKQAAIFLSIHIISIDILVEPSSKC